MPIFSKNMLRWPALTVAALLAIAPALAQEEQAPKKNNFGPRNPQAQPGQGQAQGQGAPRAQGPAPQIVATHGDWKIQCTDEPKPGGAQGETERQCGMVQLARSEKNAKIGLTTVFVRGKQNGKDITMMRIMAPIGVYLPTGVALEIDGGAVGRIPFMRCLPQICVAFGEAGGPTLDKFRKGSAANFIIYEAPGISMPIKVSLNGFAAAFTALGKL